MNVKFLMKSLSILLVCNIFFYPRYLHASEYLSTSEDEEHLLGEDLLAAIGPREQQIIQNPSDMVGEISFNGSLKELMKYLSNASDIEKGGFFAKEARRIYEFQEKLSVLYVLNIIEAAHCYKSNNNCVPWIGKAFSFIKEHPYYKDHLSEDFREFIEKEQEKILGATRCNQNSD